MTVDTTTARTDGGERTDGRPRRAALRASLLGEHGFERATVWGAVGFALAFVSFDLLPVSDGGTAAWLAATAVAVGALGAVAMARIGTGALPCTLFMYGPAAAVGLRTVEPRYLDALPAGAAVEPLAVAAAVALAIGPASYVVGRVIAPADG
ncbi:hypothetical protein [Halorubrum vacuolatum]|uniref:Uncharacterized protein n=1 Tax=Halorubrum vacuolatum TaxID=63740 RepID=A0A238WJN9_HALVU|nr:hypothetical protein [Halorubrum vacuolatum]SNR46541.1 hypothetical protein SAMN06264855_10853 [Halorubrum vacuolatum]